MHLCFLFNEPESFINNEIIRIHDFASILTGDDLPQDDSFVTNEWVYLDGSYDSPDFESHAFIDASQVPIDYIRCYGMPDIVGRNYEIHIKDVLRKPYMYKDLLCLLENDEFPLKAEFLVIRHYFQELIDRHDVVGDDFFDLFQ